MGERYMILLHHDLLLTVLFYVRSLPPHLVEREVSNGIKRI